MQVETTTPVLNILHLEDSETDHALVKFALRRSKLDFNIQRVETLSDFLGALSEHCFDVVLADYYLPGFTALDAWRATAHHSQRPPFVLISGAIGETAAVHAIREGVSDYLLKENTERLSHVIQQSIAAHLARSQREQAVNDLMVSQGRLADLTAHLQISTEHERAAIAREIHDDIGGALTAAKFDLAWISRHASDAALLQHAVAATEMIQHALEASQRIMLNLRPAILDQGLIAALHWLSNNFSKRTGVRVHFNCSSEYIETTLEIQLVAYRTAQEALTNVSKYAQCSEVHIDLAGSEGVLTLEITDNGRGFFLDAVNKKKSFGLSGLGERAATVSGWLDISSTPHHGTSITLSVPLPSSTFNNGLAAHD